METSEFAKLIHDVGLPTALSIAMFGLFFWERKQNLALQQELLKLSSAQSAAFARIDAILAVLSTRKSAR